MGIPNVIKDKISRLHNNFIFVLNKNICQKTVTNTQYYNFNNLDQES